MKYWCLRHDAIVSSVDRNCMLNLTVGYCQAYRSTGWASAFETLSIAVIILLSTATFQALLMLYFLLFCFVGLPSILDNISLTLKILRVTII